MMVIIKQGLIPEKKSAQKTKVKTSALRNAAYHEWSQGLVEAGRTADALSGVIKFKAERVRAGADLLYIFIMEIIEDDPEEVDENELRS